MDPGTLWRAPIELWSNDKNSYFNLYPSWYQCLHIWLAGITAAKPDVRSWYRLAGYPSSRCKLQSTYTGQPAMENYHINVSALRHHPSRSKHVCIVHIGNVAGTRHGDKAISFAVFFLWHSSRTGKLNLPCLHPKRRRLRGLVRFVRLPIRRGNYWKFSRPATVGECLLELCRVRADKWVYRDESKCRRGWPYRRFLSRIVAGYISF